MSDASRPRATKLRRLPLPAVLLVATTAFVCCGRTGPFTDSSDWSQVAAGGVSASVGAAYGGAAGVAAQPAAGAASVAGGAPPIVILPVRFAIIGDFGTSSVDEAAVATLVNGLNPDFIVTTGDNNYPTGSADTIDANIGQFYHQYIGHYHGSYGDGARVNRFFPVLGNHDWYTPDARPYLDYFDLPNNERYYTVRIGAVQIFAIDSDPNEPDGITSDSMQAQWLKDALSISTARWRAVFFHHPPYSSGLHGSTTALRWPFGAWGAQLVFCGHDHTYERLLIDGVTYIVNGLGGNTIYPLEAPIDGSLIDYNQTHGALLVEADAEHLTSSFLTEGNQVIDSVTLP